MRNFIRETWLKLRMGYSSYLAYAIAFINLNLLVSLRFGSVNITGLYGVDTLIVSSGIFLLISVPAIVLGHLHLKHQQSTDLRLEYEWQIEETANRVIKKLKDEGLV